MPIEEAEIAPQSFDVVILAAVLEHLYDPDAVIRSIAKVLKPGGFLFVDVPNEKGLYFKIGNLYNKLRGRDWCVNLAPTFPPFHVFGFSPASIKRLLEKHGLRPKRIEVYGGKSVIPVRGGLTGWVERIGGSAVTAISNLGNMGTYIEIWAEKS
jgi:SAM-dependent methyltransferase